MKRPKFFQEDEFIDVIVRANEEKYVMVVMENYKKFSHLVSCFTGIAKDRCGKNAEYIEFIDASVLVIRAGREMFGKYSQIFLESLDYVPEYCFKFVCSGCYERNLGAFYGIANTRYFPFRGFFESERALENLRAAAVLKR